MNSRCIAAWNRKIRYRLPLILAVASIFAGMTFSRQAVGGAAPTVRSHLPQLAGFVDGLHTALEAAELDSPQKLARRCDDFFTPARMAEIEAVLPGWQAMASYQDGKTMCHTMQALVAMRDLPEFAAATPTQRNLMEWVVLLHDLAKEPPPGGRDHRHAFRSAARAGATLPALGFPVTAAWEAEFEAWRRLTDSAHRFDPALGTRVQDNARLPEIMAGIGRLFERDTPLVVKAIALHLSLTVVEQWPAPVTLTPAEEQAYLDPDLLPILGVMFLADSGGWSLFDPTTLEVMYGDTRRVMARLAGRPAVASPGGELEIRIRKTEDARIDVLAGGDPFTSYHYGLGWSKPIFHPLRGPTGRIVTRGYPMEPGIPGENHDHWHHESLWFTYGDVNGVDFWARREAGRGGPASGKVRHTGFSRLKSGSPGVLEASAEWIAPDGAVLLDQTTLARFHATPRARRIDLTIRLTARDEEVAFGDTKEGMLGLRVAPSLREDRTGSYLNAEGLRKEAGVWGKRSAWVALRGRIDEEPLTLAILEHPSSTGSPTYWHARGYGLFAANPFGRKDFEPGAEAIDFRLGPGESAVFRYRILIRDEELSPEQLRQEFERFAADSDPFGGG